MDAAALVLPESRAPSGAPFRPVTGEPPSAPGRPGRVAGEVRAAVALAGQAPRGDHAGPGGLPDLGPDVPRVHTPGSAKGLEFDVVAVVDPEAIGAACPADLYVAMTRATQRLVLLDRT